MRCWGEVYEMSGREEGGREGKCTLDSRSWDDVGKVKAWGEGGRGWMRM